MFKVFLVLIDLKIIDLSSCIIKSSGGFWGFLDLIVILVRFFILIGICWCVRVKGRM